MFCSPVDHRLLFLLLIAVLGGALAACDQPPAEPIRRVEAAPGPQPAQTLQGDSPPPSELVTIPWTPNFQTPPYRPPPPKSLTVLDWRALRDFFADGFSARMDADLRALLGDRRQTFYDDSLVSTQVAKGYSGYSELMSAPGGRRIFWGYRTHAALTQYAVLYEPDRKLTAVAVREAFLVEAPGLRMTVFLPAGRKGQAEVAILRDWSLYMTSVHGVDVPPAEVRIVRLK